MTKYSAGVEEHSKVKLYAGNSEENLTIHTVGIQNEKISGVKAELKQKAENERPRKEQEGRLLGITEAVWWLFSYNYVISTFDFVHLPTIPIESRGTIQKKRNTQHTQNIPGSIDPTTLVIRARQHLPDFRKLTNNQIALLKDNYQSETGMDKITMFGLRPPELLYVESPVLYFKWFVREKATKKPKNANVHEFLITTDQSQALWVDATGAIVRLRRAAVPCFITYTNQVIRQNCLQIQQACNMFLNTIGPEHESKVISSDITLSETTAVVVTSNVLPRNSPKFLIHIVLSMGLFTTELDIFNVPTMLEAFRKAKLIGSGPPTIEDVRSIMRKYILEQLMYMPGGIQCFDRHCENAWNVLKEFLLHNNLAFREPPPVILQQIVEENEFKCNAELSLRRETLAKALHINAVSINLPTTNQMIAATKENPFDWQPELILADNQSELSLTEQQGALNELKQSIDSYFGNEIFHQHRVIIGPPGTGKTFLMIQAAIYAVVKGLYCSITSIAAERAAAFGGIHVHQNAGLSTNEQHSAAEMAAFGINKLSKQPICLAVIRKLEVLFVEEIGMISGEQYTAMDLIYQHVRENRLPFGGVLLIGTGDPRQLKPPTGSILWMSPLLLTSFRLHQLTQYVRMNRNGHGQRLLTLMGRATLTNDQVDEVISIISNNCTFIDDWTDIVERPGHIRVFGTRAEEREAIEFATERIRSDPNIECFIATATDEMSTTGNAIWKPADKSATEILQNRCLEPTELTLYLHAPLRLTANNMSSGYTQGQLCIIKQIPKEGDNGLYVYVSPFGNRDFPEDMSTFDFAGNNWKLVRLTTTAGHVRSVRGRSLRRTQYPVKHFFAATIHNIK